MKASKTAPNRRTAELAELRRIKRGVCKRLREMIAPLTWRSAYEGVQLFSFEQAGMRAHYKVRGTCAADLSDPGIDRFYQDGVADAWGGGCATTPFEAFGIEDLLLIERLVVRLLPRMQAGSKAFKADIEERARKTAEDAQSSGTCVGCVHRHYVVADERGTSMTGWGCLQTGGHAVKRCELFSRG